MLQAYGKQKMRAQVLEQTKQLSANEITLITSFENVNEVIGYNILGIQEI